MQKEAREKDNTQHHTEFLNFKSQILQGMHPGQGIHFQHIK